MFKHRWIALILFVFILLSFMLPRASSAETFYITYSDQHPARSDIEWLNEEVNFNFNNNSFNESEARDFIDSWKDFLKENDHYGDCRDFDSLEKDWRGGGPKYGIKECWNETSFGLKIPTECTDGKADSGEFSRVVNSSEVKDKFNAEFQGRFYFKGGEYLIGASYNSGRFRMWLDGDQIMSKYAAAGKGRMSIHIENIKRGMHDVRLSYRHSRDYAYFKFMSCRAK